MSDLRLRRRYRAALCSMPRVAARVFWMHRIQDLSIAEIATRLGLDHDEVEQRLAGAIVAIDQALAAPDEDG